MGDADAHGLASAIGVHCDHLVGVRGTDERLETSTFGLRLVTSFRRSTAKSGARLSKYLRINALMV